MLHFCTGVNSLIPHLQLAQDGLKMAIEQASLSLGRAGEKRFTTCEIILLHHCDEITMKRNMVSGKYHLPRTRH